MDKRHLHCLAGLAWAALSGCGSADPPPPTADAGTDARPTDLGPTTDLSPGDVGLDAPGDAPADAGSAAAAIERVLDDPTALTSHRDEAPDARATALMARVPSAPTWTTVPNQDGFLADPLESSALARPFFAGRPHRFGVQIDVVGGPSATAARLSGALASAHGIVLPRQVFDLEPGDAFRARTAGPTALSRVDWDLSLADAADHDGLAAEVLLLDRADTTLTLTVGTQTVSIDTASPTNTPRIVALDDGGALVVTLARDPQGHCLNTRATVAVTTHMGTAGAVGEFFGVLHRAGSHAGFVHGVFGLAPTAGVARVVFRAVDRSGHFLWSGRADGGMTSTPRVGLLTDAAGAVAGSFRVRTADGDEGSAGGAGTLPLSFEIHTECR